MKTALCCPFQSHGNIHVFLNGRLRAYKKEVPYRCEL